MGSHGQEIDRNLLKANRVFCAEAALKIALHSLDLFGGYGVIRGMRIEKLVRDAIGIQHGEGGHKVLNLSMGKELETRLNKGIDWLGRLSPKVQFRYDGSLLSNIRFRRAVAAA